MSSTSPPVRFYVGLDAHHDTISACVYDADEKRYCDEQMRTSRRVSLGLWNRASHFKSGLADFWRLLDTHQVHQDRSKLHSLIVQDF